MKLKIFKNSFISELQAHVSGRVQEYLAGDFAWCIEDENASKYNEIDAPWLNETALLSLNEVTSKQDEVDDARDAKIVFEAMSSIPPELARDQRLWTTLCHTHCAPYIRLRNHKFLFVSDLEEQIRVIKSRFFLENMTRAFERTNALARLWWFGYLVQQTGLDFEKGIVAQLADTGFRADTIERPDAFFSKEIRTAILSSAVDASDAKDNFWTSPNRKLYRPVMARLTERSTRIFFPALSPELLKKSVVDLVEAAKKSNP